jgi:NAD(P)-dependent dehydrogenase (short-subunit alcohol dehydrogenase family)
MGSRPTTFSRARSSPASRGACSRRTRASANFWIGKSPLQRLGMPDDVASAILFLASEEASFVTGHGLAVDGGALATP